MKNLNPILLCDGYKTSHHKMYPEGTTLVYSNFTPRTNKHAPAGIDKVVSFGQQAVMTWLHEEFKENFFKRPKTEVINEIQDELSLYLGTKYDTSHFEALHDLGYLPIMVKSIEEGVEVPLKIPVLTIYNTHHDFFWLPNFLETIISNMLWLPMTSATIALRYKRILTNYAKLTDPENLPFVDFQGHDFSMRGMGGVTSAILSGMGHGVVFSGSDTVPAIKGLRKYYKADGFVLGSVPASEHSVMCAGSKEDEVETFRRLLAAYPEGLLSVVSDTWDLWKVCTEYLPILKDELIQRNLDNHGKLVIRPDSGDPVDILCGELPSADGFYYDLVPSSTGIGRETVKVVDLPKHKGVIELLWDVFGGTINAQGYKVLHPCIGAIYGDSITPERAEEICRRLADKGFASTNVVFGIGSYTYQYKTRDTFGFAMKATYVERDVEIPNTEQIRSKGFPIFKDPVTDDGTKKSATGLLQVIKNGGEYVLNDNVDWCQEATGCLKIIYVDGILHDSETLSGIRTKINSIV